MSTQQEYDAEALNITLLAEELADKSAHQVCTPSHLMLVMASRGDAALRQRLIDGGVKLDSLVNHQVESIRRRVLKDEAAQLRSYLSTAESVAQRLKHPLVTQEHLFLSLLENEDVRLGLTTSGANLELLVGRLRVDMKRDSESEQNADLASSSLKAEQAEVAVHEEKIAASSKKDIELGQEESDKLETPFLDKYCQDLTQKARDGGIDPVIGRGHEIRETIAILGRKLKNNAVIVGEPGVGKTAIAEGLALRIASNDVPPYLRDVRFLSLDMGTLTAGTKMRGEFEERLTNIVAEVKLAGNIVLFLDEIHLLIGAGAGAGGPDAANLLKPALSRGELRCVGATTQSEFRKHIEKDGAFSRRFQAVDAPEPSREETLTILTGLRETYQAHHQVNITTAAIEASVRLSMRYLPERFLPDKAIDLMDQAAAHLRLDHSETAAAQSSTAELGEAEIAKSLEKMTKIPVAKIMGEEAERLTRLESILSQRVAGQPDAVEKIAKAVRRSRASVGDAERPTASFLMLGPTGVGKTELAKTLAQFLFDDESALIRIDMSEYMEKHSISRLVGAPPGYVGCDEGGVLTNQVRRRPYSVVLFDEVEKAHQDVFNILLQVLDEGHLTDSLGNRVNFKNTVFLMTSNLGAAQVDYATASQDELSESMKQAAAQFFRPELLNRLDDLVVFQPLSRETMLPIVHLQTKRVAKRLLEQNIELEISDGAAKLLAIKGYSPAHGARELKRIVQREIQDPVADLILSEAVTAGGKVVVEREADELTISAL